jgi:hypothetical protein
MELAEVRALDLAGLERLFREAPVGPLPGGVFRGTHLARLESLERRPLWRTIDRLAFETVPFGIDFDQKRWWFGHRKLAVGHFRTTAAPVHSRWRDTDVIALEYDVSRLPRKIRDVLYDEVKPLSDRLCLGLGGINREVGEGDHFFFALERL